MNIEGIFKSKHHPLLVIQIIMNNDEKFEFNLLEPSREWLFARHLKRIGQNQLIGNALTIEFPDEEFNFFDISRAPITLFELIGRWERIFNNIEEIDQ